MKTFLESSVTKVILISLAIDLLVALVPMLEAQSINVWALGVAGVKSLILLLGNALRADINVPGLNWFGPKAPPQ